MREGKQLKLFDFITFARFASFALKKDVGNSQPMPSAPITASPLELTPPRKLAPT